METCCRAFVPPAWLCVIARKAFSGTRSLVSRLTHNTDRLLDFAKCHLRCCIADIWNILVHTGVRIVGAVGVACARSHSRRWRAIDDAASATVVDTARGESTGTGRRGDDVAEFPGRAQEARATHAAQRDAQQRGRRLEHDQRG
jgi:hypothetical protein